MSSCSALEAISWFPKSGSINIAETREIVFAAPYGGMSDKEALSTGSLEWIPTAQAKAREGKSRAEQAEPKTRTKTKTVYLSMISML